MELCAAFGALTQNLYIAREKNKMTISNTPSTDVNSNNKHVEVEVDNVEVEVEVDNVEVLNDMKTGCHIIKLVNSIVLYLDI